MATDSLANRDAALIDLAARRGLITSQRARELVAGLAGRTAAVALVEAGLDVHVVRSLREDQRRNCIPSKVHGYRLVSHLGNGGMSVVFRGEADGKPPVAIKLLSPRLDQDPRATARFSREIRSAADVIDPHVIRCFGHGEANGRPYQVLELMEGGDCQTLQAKRGGLLDEVLALRIAEQAARGLIAVHAAGLIHRDIKPGNLFLAADGTAKVADLGLARMPEVAEADQVTLPGTLVGSPAYMSPEQARGGIELDGRTDIYSLGATLFHFVTGRVPFPTNSPIEAVRAAALNPTPNAGALRPDLSPSIVKLLARAMAKDRNQRYPDAASFAAAIAAAAAGQTVSDSSGGLVGWWHRLVASVGRWLAPAQEVPCKP